MDPQPTKPLLFLRGELSCAFSFLFLMFSSLLLISPLKPQWIIRRTLPNKNLTSSSLAACDYAVGKWVRNDAHLLASYTEEECPFLDQGFKCRNNGRKNVDYLRWKWQPAGCDFARFNASDFLERSRHGRIVFAGDSIGRNQWESLVCMLAEAVGNKSTIFEENGNSITKHKGFLSIRFLDYNLTVEYYRAPFLVISDRPPPDSADQIKSAIRVDQLHRYHKHWNDADVLVFNAGHWWTEDKITRRGSYFQEGEAVNMTMTLIQAFQKTLQTWKSWVIQNTDPKHSYIFFRSYSPVHFREGAWNAGGRCDHDVAPESNYSKLEAEAWNNMYIYETIEQMQSEKRNIQFLNITYLSEFRVDGHPSIHREPGTPVPFIQDCSHWCLPGVPDTWNKLLYSHLLSRDYRTKKSQ